MSRVNRPDPAPAQVPDTCSTTEAARRLGMAVRSVQLMVDRGELQAWKTPGGHRRILRSSLDAWLATRAGTPATAPAPAAPRDTGLALAGRLEPDVLLIDILLPGIDGAALITSLRSHPQFARSRLIVVTALDEAQRAPYRFALDGVPVVHKTDLVTQLPALLAEAAAALPA